MKKELSDAIEAGAQVEKIDIMIDHTLIKEFHEDFLEQVAEVDLKEFNLEVMRYHHEGNENAVLDGLYLLPIENILLALIYENGNLIPSKSKASIITPIVTTTLSIEDTDRILLQGKDGEVLILEDYIDSEKPESKETIKH